MALTLDELKPLGITESFTKPLGELQQETAFDIIGLYAKKPDKITDNTDVHVVITKNDLMFYGIDGIYMPEKLLTHKNVPYSPEEVNQSSSSRVISPYMEMEIIEKEILGGYTK